MSEFLAFVLFLVLVAIVESPLGDLPGEERRRRR